MAPTFQIKKIQKCSKKSGSYQNKDGRLCYIMSCYLFLYFQVGGVSLKRVTRWDRWGGMGGMSDMCGTAAGGIALRMGRHYVNDVLHGSPYIRVLNRERKTVTAYYTLCECTTSEEYQKNISELIAGQYLATSCDYYGCNTVKVVDTRTHEVASVYSGRDTGCKLSGAMCTAGEGPLLIWDNKGKSVIQLKFNEQRKELDEVRPRVQLPGHTVYHMCYMPHADLLILSRGERMVEAVKLHRSAGQPPVWQLQGEVLGKKINPQGVSCDSEGRVYVADGKWRSQSRVLLLNGYTGEVIQQLLKDDGVGKHVLKVCCLSNPHQLLVYGSNDDTHLYNVDTL